MSESKVCVKCGVEKELNYFTKDKDCQNGVSGVCKSCRSKYQSEYTKNKNKNKIKSKVCAKCGIEKKTNNFHRNKQSKDGYSHNCRMCSIVLKKERIKLKDRKPETIKEVIPEIPINPINEKNNINQIEMAKNEQDNEKDEKIAKLEREMAEIKESLKSSKSSQEALKQTTSDKVKDVGDDLDDATKIAMKANAAITEANKLKRLKETIGDLNALFNPHRQEGLTPEQIEDQKQDKTISLIQSVGVDEALRILSGNQVNLEQKNSSGLSVEKIDKMFALADKIAERNNEMKMMQSILSAFGGSGGGYGGYADTESPAIKELKEEIRQLREEKNKVDPLESYIKVMTAKTMGGNEDPTFKAISVLGPMLKPDTSAQNQQVDKLNDIISTTQKQIYERDVANMQAIAAMKAESDKLIREIQDKANQDKIDRLLQENDAIRNDFTQELNAINQRIALGATNKEDIVSSFEKLNKFVETGERIKGMFSKFAPEPIVDKTGEFNWINALKPFAESALNVINEVSKTKQMEAQAEMLKTSVKAEEIKRGTTPAAAQPNTQQETKQQQISDIPDTKSEEIADHTENKEKQVVDEFG